MTEKDCIAFFHQEEVSKVSYRNLTVSYASRYKDFVYTPAIMMKGLWLEAAGFTTGTIVDVMVMDGTILLTTNRPPKKPKTMTSLELINKMTAAEKKRKR